MATNFYGPVTIGTKVTVESGGTYIRTKVESGGMYIEGQSEEKQKEDGEEKLYPPLTSDILRKYIDALLPQIEHQNQWFAIVKPLVWQEELIQSDYEGAVKYINNIYPEGLLINVQPDDLRKLDNLCFSKPLDKWNEENAPIHGNRYKKMYALTSCFWNMINKHEKRKI